LFGREFVAFLANGEIGVQSDHASLEACVQAELSQLWLHCVLELFQRAGRNGHVLGGDVA
jgi:hypothetical protein